MEQKLSLTHRIRIFILQMDNSIRKIIFAPLAKYPT